MCSLHMSVLCVCMRDVISEFNSEIEGTLAANTLGAQFGNIKGRKWNMVIIIQIMSIVSSIDVIANMLMFFL